MLETPEEIDRLQELLDRSAAGAGAHLRGIISDDHRLSAVLLLQLGQGLGADAPPSRTSRGQRQAMLDHYLPTQGPAFETWLDEADAVAARVDADKMFTYSTSD